MHSGNYDAIILAVAGIKRLGIGTNLITEYLPAETFVPAPGQGALAIECRIDDEELNELLLKINNPKSEQTTLAERAFLVYFDEGESAPIGGFAEVDGDNILFHGMVISRDGTRVIEHIEKDSDPVKAANKTAELLIDQGAYDIIRGALRMNSLNNQNVLVTRAKEQATVFADKIHQFGGNAWIADVTRITCTSKGMENIQ